jgi:hypothetical protein
LATILVLLLAFVLDTLRASALDRAAPTRISRDPCGSGEEAIALG